MSAWPIHFFTRTMSATAIIGGILGHACRPAGAAGFGLPSNPAPHVDKLGEKFEDTTDYLSPAEIVSVAAALRRGAHRNSEGVMPAGGAFAKDVHRLARAADDTRDAAAVLIAGFAGVLRWHGLRHSFVTAAREGFGADRVQQMAGHEDARTAQRYAHARSAADDAERLSVVLAAQMPAVDAEATAS